MILLLDNYDSFVHNVARSMRELGAVVEVVRSDQLTVDEAVACDPSHLVVSPGPCTPMEAGISVALIRALGGRVPVLGICLGHQAVAVAYGGVIIPSPDPAHGVTRDIHHGGVGILRGIPVPFPAGLYHSLSVHPGLPEPLEGLAWTESGELMALGHRTHPVWGVQFHPESILTRDGDAILANFLEVGPRAMAPDDLATRPSSVDRTGDVGTAAGMKVGR